MTGPAPLSFEPQRDSSQINRGKTSNSISQLLDALCFGTVVTAEKRPAGFQTVPDDPHPAVFAGRRQGRDCALKTIERMLFPTHHNLKRLVVSVSTHLTCCHSGSPFPLYTHPLRKLRVRLHTRTQTGFIIRLKKRRVRLHSRLQTELPIRPEAARVRGPFPPA